MSVKNIKHKLLLLKVKATLKLNSLLHQNQLSSGEPISKFGPLKNISKFLNAQEIFIQLDGADKNKKEFIFELINLLGKHNIDVTLIEFEKIFDNEDIRKILSQNPNTNITLRYIYQSYKVGLNSELTYSVSTYCKILEKIEFLCTFAKENFKQVDEQTVFIITQLADYITFDTNYEHMSLQELKIISNLESALLERKTVCIRLRYCSTTLFVKFRSGVQYC